MPWRLTSLQRSEENFLRETVGKRPSCGDIQGEKNDENQKPGVTMNRQTAEFWAKTITKLFAGRKALFVDSFHGYKPSIIVTKIREAKSLPVGQDNKWFFHVTSDYGVHDGLVRVSLDLDNHTIVMRATDEWRLLVFLDKCSLDDHGTWMKAQEEAARLPDETNP
jgi:hypothetical protein